MRVLADTGEDDLIAGLYDGLHGPDHRYEILIQNGSRGFQRLFFNGQTITGFGEDGLVVERHLKLVLGGSWGKPSGRLSPFNSFPPCPVFWLICIAAHYPSWERCCWRWRLVRTVST